MSTDLYCVLQKLNKKTGKYETILDDAFGRDHRLHSFLGPDNGYGRYENIAHKGLPKDFEGEIGEWGHGWVTLKEFCEAPLPPPPKISNRFEHETHDSGYTVTFIEDEEADAYYGIRAYQLAFSSLFQTYYQGTEFGETYRLVFGYG